MGMVLDRRADAVRRHRHERVGQGSSGGSGSDTGNRAASGRHAPMATGVATRGWSDVDDVTPSSISFKGLSVTRSSLAHLLV